MYKYKEVADKTRTNMIMNMFMIQGLFCLDP